MKSTNDISVEGLAGRSPFVMPEGYLENLEDTFACRISAPQPTGFRHLVKPALGLACAFALVFGMGYGVLALTGTLKEKSGLPEGIGIIDEALLSSNFIDFYDNSDEDAVEKEGLDEEDMICYLETEASNAYLSEKYAQLQ